MCFYVCMLYNNHVSKMLDVIYDCDHVLLQSGQQAAKSKNEMADDKVNFQALFLFYFIIIAN